MTKNIFSLFIFAVFSLALLTFVPNKAMASDNFELPQDQNYKVKNQKILKEYWSTSLKTGKPGRRYFPETNTPTIKNNIVYIGTHAGMFYALNQKTGKTLWEYNNKEGVATTAGVDNDLVVFSDFGGNLVCLKAKDGVLLWKRYFGKEMLSAPLFYQNKIFVISGESTIMALSEKNGSTTWKKEIGSFIKKLTIRGTANIVASNNALYFGLADGYLYKLNSANGSLLWSKKLTAPLSTFKDIDASVVIKKDNLYVGGYFGLLYCLNLNTGSIKWQTEIATGTPVLVYKDIVVVADNNGALHGLNKQTGKELWLNKLNGSVLSQPVLYKDKIFVSSFKKEAYLINPETGYQIQNLKINSGSINSPVVKDKNIYLLTNNAKLIALSH